MSYHRLIAYGTNGKKEIFLDRWDDTYSVSVHSSGKNHFHEDFDSMTDATLRFFKVCKKHGIEPKKM